MKIAIDASRAVKEKPTGTEFYSARVIEYLAKVDQDNTYYLYTPTPPPASFPKLPSNFHWKVIPFPRLWTHLRFSLALWFNKPDLVFIPAHVVPLLMPSIPTVVTLHDVAYEVFPEVQSWFATWYSRFSSKLALKRAKAIITPSKATKDDLIRIYKADGSKIYPIHLGFDQPKEEVVEIPDKIKTLQPFFLMVGRLETRKNTAFAIRAFGQFKKERPKDRTKLVLIGKPGYGYETVVQAKSELPEEIARDIVELGYVSNEDLAAYRATTTALLYPSLYEGFGLVILEAMAAGIPIVTSDISSMPEVAGDAAILIDPHSTDDFVKAMNLLTTNDLTGRELAELGKAQVKNFSWQKTAEQTLEIFRKAKDKV